MTRRNIKQWLSIFRLLGRFSTTWKSFETGVALKANLLTKLIYTMIDPMSGGSIENLKGTTNPGANR
jgi:hypothetical protein